MKYASKLEFSTINNFAVISDYVIGESIQQSGINDGDSVLLRFDNAWINVISVQKEKAGVFQGIIDGFEPSGTSFNTLHLGDDIEFNEEHVFVCVKRS